MNKKKLFLAYSTYGIPDQKMANFMDTLGVLEKKLEETYDVVRMSERHKDQWSEVGGFDNANFYWSDARTCPSAVHPHLIVVVVEYPYAGLRYEFNNAVHPDFVGKKDDEEGHVPVLILSTTKTDNSMVSVGTGSKSFFKHHTYIHLRLALIQGAIEIALREMNKNEVH